MPSNAICSRCGRPWPGSELLGATCPACMIDFAFAPADADPCSATETALTHLGPYTLLEPLGRGGMASVCKARHDALGRIVALKVLHPECACQDGFPQRFQREGQFLATLAHPHIVGIHDIGCESGTYYLAMEYVEGQTLRQLLDAGPLPWPTAVDLFAQLCEALSCAHDRGIVHRDVKPENILLDPAGRVKVADFGIAKLVTADDRVALTETNARIGTRCYMAPEQLERSRCVDHRADIYALGVVLYEMLTGELPLGIFAPPSRKAAVDPRLDAVLLRALAKEPEKRYAHVSAFQEAVLRLRAGRRSRVGWMAAVLLLALGATMFGVLRHRPADTPPVEQSQSVPTQPAEGPQILTGHTAPVGCVAYTRDGTLLASAAEDRSVRLWDPATGRAVATLPDALSGEEHGPVCLAFSPDGVTLATAGRESVIRLWDVRGRKERRRLTGHGREVNAVAFAPDGATLVSVSLDLTVRLWDVASGKPRRELEMRADQGQHPPLSVAFAPDGKRIAAGVMSGEVLLWNAESGKLATSSFGHAKRAWAVAFAPDSKLLASGSHDQTIKFWDLTSLPPRAQVHRVASQVWCVAFAPDGNTLAAGCQDGTVQLWDVPGGRLAATLSGHGEKVSSVAFAPNGRTLATGSWDRTVRLWRLPAVRERQERD